MVTSLATGDKIHVGDSITLTILAIEGDLVSFGVESSEPGHDPHVEMIPESDSNWWESN
jgi:hypothetical protein